MEYDETENNVKYEERCATWIEQSDLSDLEIWQELQRRG